MQTGDSDILTSCGVSGFPLHAAPDTDLRSSLQSNRILYYNVAMDAVYQFRDATNDDWKLLLSWRNDPLTRAHSFSQEEIREKEHRSWLADKLNDPDCRMVIITSDDVPVGVLRLDRRDCFTEISYTVAPEARGKGCGKYIVGLAEKIAPDDVTRLEATVLSDNPASIRCFEANGYTSDKLDETFRFYKVIRS